MLSIENIDHIDDILANRPKGKWFFRKLRNLKRYAVEAAKKVENTLFSTQAVQEVVENANFSFLEDFFRSLSPEVFGPSLPLLVEKWKKWPQKSGYFSFKIIEELDREQAQVLAREFLQDENSLFDIDKSSAVTQFIASTVMSGNDELAEQYLKRVEEVPNPFLKEIYERIAFSTALAGGVDLGRKVFRNLIVTGIEKENLGNILGDIYMYGTEGLPFYMGLREKSLTKGLFSTLVPLFATGAPVDFFDRAQKAKGDQLYKEALKLWKSVDFPHRTSLFQIVDLEQPQWKKTIGQSRYKREFGLFLTAIMIACWLDPSPGLGALPTEELLRLGRVPMDPLPWRDTLLNELKARPEDEVAGAFQSQFTRCEQGGEDLTGLVSMGGELGYQSLVPLLLELLFHCPGSLIAGAVSEALISCGEESLPRLYESWEGADVKMKIYLLDAMERLSSPRFSDFLVESWELMQAAHLKTWCQGALASADEKVLLFLEARMEADPKSMTLGALRKTYVELSELLSMNRPFMDRIVQAQRRELSPGEQRGPGIELDLQCPLCQEEAQYWVSTLIVTKGFHLDHPLVGGELHCSFCGGYPRFQITQHGFGKYIEEFGRISGLVNMGNEYESPIRLVEPFLVKGSALSIPQALSFFEEKVRENPKSPKYHLYLGHIYQLVGNNGQALEHFSQTISHDATNIEAPFFMAMVLYDMGRLAEAHSILGLIRLHVNGWSYYIFEKKDRKKTGESIANLYNMLLKNLSIRNISQLQPDFLLHQKIGANDRCPCGSGRKFKICCMKKGIY